MSELEWILLAPKNPRGAKLRYIPEPKPLTQFTFDVKHLLTSPYGADATPNHIYPDSTFLFIGVCLAYTMHYNVLTATLTVLAPRKRNIYAPIDTLFDADDRRAEQVPPHRCFAARVVHPIIHARACGSSPVCYPICTPGPIRDDGPVTIPSYQSPSPLPDFDMQEDQEVCFRSELS